MSWSPKVITHNKPMPNCAMLVVYIRLWALSDMNTAIIYLDIGVLRTPFMENEF